MKKHLLILMLLGFSLSLFSQHHVIPNKEIRQLAVKKGQPIPHQKIGTKSPATPSFKNSLVVDESVIGKTFYDLQTNGTMQRRIFVYDDGSIGSTFTFSGETGFTDRGTGYNYFDGSDWGDYPTERIESVRTGWPTYVPYGENGELVVSHDYAIGSLYYLWRDEKGTGDWSEEEFAGPAGQKISWNSSFTSGINNSVIHTLCITFPVANGGTVYQGQDGALLYSRSTDGGTTWDPQNAMFDELSSDSYKHFSADMYEWASYDENTIAFLVGDSWIDLILMKSTDGGDTWTKTVIWEHPYPLFDPQNPIVTDPFYCADGAHSLAFDQSGKVHVAFGINRASCAGSWPGSWYPGVGGIGYWNEDRPTFSADTNALCPWPGTDDCSYSELVEDYSLIGWDQDVNGNDTIDWTEADPASFYVGTSSMPQILIDDMNRIFVVYSSITETYTSGSPAQTCRHLWARTSPNGEWWGDFTDITASPIHIIDDCVYPSMVEHSDGESLVVVYQHDNQPGNSQQGNPATAILENTISVMTVDKDEVWTSVQENIIPVYDYDVSQNYPNPFNETSTVNVNIRNTSTLSLEVVNMMGQLVYTIDAGIAKPGMNTLVIDGSDLTPGIYFYTVKAGDSAITKKMIVD